MGEDIPLHIKHTFTQWSISKPLKKWHCEIRRQMGGTRKIIQSEVTQNQKDYKVFICLNGDINYEANDNQAITHRTTEDRNRVRDYRKQIDLSRKGK